MLWAAGPLPVAKRGQTDASDRSGTWIASLSGSFRGTTLRRRSAPQKQEPTAFAMGTEAPPSKPFYFTTAACAFCNNFRACEIRSTTSNGFTSDGIPFACK